MARILLIDDDLPMRQVFAAGLRKAGHDISLAEDGSVLQQGLQNLSVDLVITDIVMARVDGIETVLSLKKTKPELPILAISGTRIYLETVAQLGQAYTLLKPFSVSELIDAVDGMLPR